MEELEVRLRNSGIFSAATRGVTSTTDTFTTTNPVIFNASGTGGDTLSNYGTPKNPIGQRFALTNASSIISASVWVASKFGDASISCRIETDNAGSPSGTLVAAGATVTLAYADITTSALNAFTFATAIPLAAGTYHFVWTCLTGANTGYALYDNNTGAGGYEWKQSGVWSTSATYVIRGQYAVSTTGVTLSHYYLKNVSGITVGGVAKSWFTDYTVDYKDATPSTAYATVTFNTPISDGSAIVVSYDYGTTDRIFPDLPRKVISLADVPRIGMSILASSNSPADIGATTVQTEYTIEFILWASSQKECYDYLTDLKNWLLTNQKAMHYVPLIQPINLGPILQGIDNRLCQASLEARIKFIFES
jgi:hypothetical protein